MSNLQLSISENINVVFSAVISLPSFIMLNRILFLNIIPIVL